jgi:hypothetical protein
MFSVEVKAMVAVFVQRVLYSLSQAPPSLVLALALALVMGVSVVRIHGLNPAPAKASACQMQRSPLHPRVPLSWLL